MAPTICPSEQAQLLCDLPCNSYGFHAFTVLGSSKLLITAVTVKAAVFSARVHTIPKQVQFLSTDLFQFHGVSILAPAGSFADSPNPHAHFGWSFEPIRVLHTVIFSN